jgi:hypothetical protein
MSLRTRRVKCCDSRGVEHTIEVTAQTLYEAVAQALRVFRENVWSEDPRRGPWRVVMHVRQPEIERKVRVRDFENWLESPGGAPLKCR